MWTLAAGPLRQRGHRSLRHPLQASIERTGTQQTGRRRNRGDPEERLFGLYARWLIAILDDMSLNAARASAATMIVAVPGR